MNPLHCVHGFCGWGLLTGHSRVTCFLSMISRDILKGWGSVEKLKGPKWLGMGTEGAGSSTSDMSSSLTCLEPWDVRGLGFTESIGQNVYPWLLQRGVLRVVKNLTWWMGLRRMGRLGASIPREPGRSCVAFCDLALILSCSIGWSIRKHPLSFRGGDIHIISCGKRVKKFSTIKRITTPYLACELVFFTAVKKVEQLHASWAHTSISRGRKRKCFPEAPPTGFSHIP